MNLVTTIVSTFFTNYILMVVVRYLPLQRKKLWKTVFVSVADGLEVFSYISYIIVALIQFDIQEIGFMYFLEVGGSILGIIIAYVASMMMIDDGNRVFKSRRLKKFEYEASGKTGKSIPVYIIGIVFSICSLVLFGYGVVASIFYSQSVIISLIGSYVFGAILLFLAIWLLLPARNGEEKISKSESLLFMVTLPDNRLLFTAKLSKEFTSKEAFGELSESYFFDDFGYLITNDNTYHVKGIKVNSFSTDSISKLRMEQIQDTFGDSLNEFKRYEKRKITLDDNKKIIKNILMK